MRSLFKVCMVAVVVALLAGPASAQQRPQRPQGGGFGGFAAGLEALLTNAEVQKELKITDDQKAKIDEAVKKFNDDNKDDRDKLRNRETPREERAEITRKLGEKFNTVAKDLIKPEQMKRVKQIQLQQQARFSGPAVFATEDVQKELKITDEQKDKIKTINDDLRKDTQDLGFQDFQKRREMTTEASEKVQKLLTEEQKKAWKEMTGEPFTLNLQPRRPGGDRPNPPPGAGRQPEQPKKIDF